MAKAPVPTIDPAPDAAARPPRRTGRSPGRPTREQGEQRNRDLLERALDHFLEKGFEGTTIDAITASLGMAKRTVYARYGDKANLFKAAMQRGIDDWLVPVDSLRAAETDDLEESLHAIARILVANMMSPAGLRLLRITNTESYRMPEIGTYSYKRGTGQTIAFLVELFGRRLPPDAELADPEEVALAFLNLILGEARAVAWGMEIDPGQIDRHARFRVRLFLRGILPR
jgi:TetR/AcrR family transcriptional regulator, mexJK operon transcriptional repressor